MLRVELMNNFMFSTFFEAFLNIIGNFDSVKSTDFFVRNLMYNNFYLKHSLI